MALEADENTLIDTGSRRKSRPAALIFRVEEMTAFADGWGEWENDLRRIVKVKMIIQGPGRETGTAIHCWVDREWLEDRGRGDRRFRWLPSLWVAPSPAVLSGPGGAEKANGWTDPVLRTRGQGPGETGTRGGVGPAPAVSWTQS